MKESPDQLSQLLLEADGLLLVLLRHREETPLDAIRLLRKKLNLILAVTEGLDAEDLHDQPAEEPDDRVGEYMEDTIENPEPESYSDPQEGPLPQPVPEIVSMPEPSVPQEHIQEQVVIMDAPVTFYDDSKTTVDNDFTYTYYPNHDTEPEENTLTQQHETTSNQRRPIASAFNLNDKFRFRRELFGNSDAAWVECLDTLSAMYTLDEAREYLAEDLKWDTSNDDVAAFIERLETYFNH